MVTPNPISREGEEADEPVPLRSAILSAAPWSRVLVWFLRTMAIVWLIMGLVAWADILGVATALVPFDQRTLSAQSVVVYFAVIDLVAAVGLWLTSHVGRRHVAARADEPPHPWRSSSRPRWPAVASPSRSSRASWRSISSLSWLAAHEEAE